MSHLTKLFHCALALTILISFACGQGKGSAAKILDTASKATKKLEVRHSFIGFRDTVIFYTFEEQKAVLRVGIDNETTDFPVTATVYVFAEDVTADGLSKWLNNQHSDGLFPEVPKPVASYKIPEKSCSKVSHKLIDRSKQELGEHDNYAVKFRIEDVTEKGVFQLKAFTSETKVHVKTK